MNEKMKRRSIGGNALILIFLTLTPLSFAGTFGNSPVSTDELYEEYVVKAAWVERFTRFIDWPDNVNNNNSSKTFVIGVIGNTPLTQQLEILYNEQKVKIKDYKDVKIRIISSIEDSEGCHILFIARSLKSRLPSLLSYLKNKPILTIGDTEGFGQKGVHINYFSMLDGKLKFELNRTAIKSAGLSVNYHLVAAAGKLVGSMKDGK